MLVVPPRRAGSGAHARGWRAALLARFANPSRLRWILGAVMAFTILGGDRGLVRLIGLVRDRSALRAEIVRLQARRAALEHDARAFATDAETIEKSAREELDLIRRGETVYKFPK